MPVRSRQASSSFPADRKLAASSFSVCRRLLRAAPHAWDEREPAKDAVQNIFFSAESFAGCRTSLGQDAMPLHRAKPAMEKQNEADLDQVPDQAGIGGQERGLDRRSVRRAEGRKA